MSKTDPFIIPIPRKITSDPELNPYFLYLQRFLHDLWKRTGGSEDFISNALISPKAGQSNLIGRIQKIESDLKRIRQNRHIPSRASRSRYSQVLAGALQRIRDSVIPSGAIIIWSGATADIPRGWVLCNGSNGTPDLRDKFVVGAGSTYAVDDTGGAVDDTLNITTDNNTGGLTTGAPNDTVEVQSGTGATVASQTHTHTSNAHNHLDEFTVDTLPPYHALAFIMKV